METSNIQHPTSNAEETALPVRIFGSMTRQQKREWFETFPKETKAGETLNIQRSTLNAQGNSQGPIGEGRGNKKTRPDFRRDAGSTLRGGLL